MIPSVRDRRRGIALAATVAGWSALWCTGLSLLPHLLAWPAAVLFTGGLALIPWSFGPPGTATPLRRGVRALDRKPSDGSRALNEMPVDP